MHSILYKFSNVYRYKAEVEAYKTQLIYSPYRVKDAELFASFILNRYKLDGLDLTLESIKKDLLS